MLNGASPPFGADRAEVRTSGTPPTSLGTLAVAVVIVVGLDFGREVFVPMALAILLSFALGPPLLLLCRWHLGRVPAVIAVVIRIVANTQWIRAGCVMMRNEMLAGFYLL